MVVVRTLGAPLAAVGHDEALVFLLRDLCGDGKRASWLGIGTRSRLVSLSAGKKCGFTLSPPTTADITNQFHADTVTFHAVPPGSGYGE